MDHPNSCHVSDQQWAAYREQGRQGKTPRLLFRDMVLADILRCGPGATVLDVGCGRGIEASRAPPGIVADAAGRFIGVEPDPGVAVSQRFCEVHRCPLEESRGGRFDRRGDRHFRAGARGRPGTFFRSLHRPSARRRLLAMTIDQRHPLPGSRVGQRSGLKRPSLGLGPRRQLGQRDRDLQHFLSEQHAAGIGASCGRLSSAPLDELALRRPVRRLPAAPVAPAGACCRPHRPQPPAARPDGDHPSAKIAAPGPVTAERGEPSLLSAAKNLVTVGWVKVARTSGGAAQTDQSWSTHVAEQAELPRPNPHQDLGLLAPPYLLLCSWQWRLPIRGLDIVKQQSRLQVFHQDGLLLLPGQVQCLGRRRGGLREHARLGIGGRQTCRASPAFGRRRDRPPLGQHDRRPAIAQRRLRQVARSQASSFKARAWSGSIRSAR